MDDGPAADLAFEDSLKGDTHLLDKLITAPPPGISVTPTGTSDAAGRGARQASSDTVSVRPRPKSIARAQTNRQHPADHIMPRPARAAAAEPDQPDQDGGPNEADLGLRHLPEAARDRLGSITGVKTGQPAQPASPSNIMPAPGSQKSKPAPRLGAKGANSAPHEPTSHRQRVAASGDGLTGWLISRMFGQGELPDAIQKSRTAFAAIGLFSLVINVLMLTGPLFMLQVYDRVMTSGSIPTLVALLSITIGLYIVIGLLELVRARLVIRIGTEIDQRVGDRVFEASLRSSITGQQSSISALRELDSFRQFVAGPGPITFCDAPWTPIYLLVIFAVHWSLGLAATAGAAVLLVMAWLSETESRGALIESGKASAKSIEIAEIGQRNAEALTAMGMLEAYRSRWKQSNNEALAWQLMAADRLGTFSSISKTLRLLLQSLMLALGAALAVAGFISAGAIIACTIIFGRALAPVEQAISQWRSFVKARESLTKLEALLKAEPPAPRRTALPKPRGHLVVSGLRVAAPETRQLILSNLNFEAVPGQMLAVIGPSASGKSTLVRTLVGLWPPFGGTIELDGSRLDQWSSEDLGRHVGYVPQAVELFSGTVRSNIARFRDDATDGDVIEAAKMAHAHELILALPKGYDTELGGYGTYLSGGQRQRLGLARALFGHPPLVVLDEPNSNLDRLGDEALGSAIDGMRRRGQTVIMVSHRVQAISKADTILYLDRGIQRAFGPRAEVMRMFQGSPEVELPNRRRDDPAARTAQAASPARRSPGTR